MAVAKAPADNAGIFATKKLPPLKPLLASLAAEARVSERCADSMGFLLYEWRDVSVQLAIAPHWDGQIQCAGMKGWISQHAARQQNKEAVAALVQKIDSTVDCVGSVITPRYDSAGKATSLVLLLATAFDGYIFSHQSFYDARGVKVIGADNDPTSLGVPPQGTHDFLVSDLIGEWSGRAPDGTICRYIFRADGACIQQVETEVFTRSFGVKGLKTKYVVRENSPFWEFDAYDFEHERMRGMTFHAIFQPLGRNVFKLEGAPEHIGPRPSCFSHEAITFTKVMPDAVRQQLKQLNLYSQLTRWFRGG